MTICRSRQSWRRILSLAAAVLAVLAPMASIYANEQTAAKTAANEENGRDAKKVSSKWCEIRDEVVRCALEVTTTAFLIRIGNPPPQPNEAPPVDPPEQNNTPPDPPGDPPPDPPTGGGEEPPIDPPFDIPDPPNETPEPASLVTALLGAGLTSLYAWRRRRRHPE